MRTRLKKRLHILVSVSSVLLNCLFITQTFSNQWEDNHYQSQKGTIEDSLVMDGDELRIYIEDISPSSGYVAKEPEKISLENYNYKTSTAISYLLFDFFSIPPPA